MKNSSTYKRMYFFGLSGFVSSFLAAWLYLKLSGYTDHDSNPLLGPPSLMICLLFGSAGLAIGAAVSVFKKK